MGAGGWSSLSATSRDALAAHAVDKISRVPGTYREFTDTAAQAARIQRISVSLLESLLDLGLPHRGSGAERRFDHLDLENASLTMRLPGPRWTAMRWWPRALRECPLSGEASYRLTVKTYCPAPPGPHRCEWDIHSHALSAAAPGSVLKTGDGYTVCLTVTCVDHIFGPPFTALIEALLPVEHHLIPDALAGDIGFMTATGLADCRLASAFLVQAGRELGAWVRPAKGLLLATPFPGWHSWVEFRTAGGWLAADPLLLSNFARWGLVDAAEWPAARSPHSFFCRWHPSMPPLVTHDGEPVRPVLELSREQHPPAQRERRPAGGVPPEAGRHRVSH